jgi:hypothetical protein
MRAVMRIGGFCASGGPYQIQTQCPKGVPGLLIGSIWLGLIFLGLYLWGTISARGPNLAGLAWPALFLSLGYNFFAFGLRPADEQGLVWGWLICGVVFVLMGGIPLAIAVLTWGRSHTSPSRAVRASGLLLAAARRATEPGPQAPGTTTFRSSGSLLMTTPPTTPPASAEDGGMIEQLERLAELRRRGDLTEPEFEAAKARLLGTEGWRT